MFVRWGTVADRAVQVAGGLDSGRRGRPAHLVIAAAAAAAGLSVLHYDGDHDRIAAVTNPANAAWAGLAPTQYG